MEQHFNASRIIELYADFLPVCKNEHEATRKKYSVDDANWLAFDKLNHPLDGATIAQLTPLKDSALTSHIQATRDLWISLIEKSIQCLRFYDEREPFIKNNKKTPIVYGLDDLEKYFKAFIDFEAMLYGSSSYYRDHVLHVVYVWGTGIARLMTPSPLAKTNSTNSTADAEYTLIEAVKNDILPFDISDEKPCTSIEIISIWTLIALCHDLGYPLEKSKNIIDKTKAMMQFFVQFPQMHHQLTFSGIQNELNIFILKFISSKMVKRESGEFAARIQSKYYMKLAKSFEHFRHGTISSIILYKNIMYFIESEYSLNEDYKFEENEAKQFYIRREILRAIATHTCPDIYHMSSQTLSFLLIICDDMQEWDRKKFKEIYFSEKECTHKSSIEEYSKESVLIEDSITIQKSTKESAIYESLLYSSERLFKELQKRFRDGLETKDREFTFRREFRISSASEGKQCVIIIQIPNREKAILMIEAFPNASSTCKQIVKDAIEDSTRLFEAPVDKQPSS